MIGKTDKAGSMPALSVSIKNKLSLHCQTKRTPHRALTLSINGGDTAVVQARDLKRLHESALPHIAGAEDKYLLQPGDVLVSTSGELLAREFLDTLSTPSTPDAPTRAIASSSIYIVRLKTTTKILPAYLEICLNSSYARAKQASAASTGIVRKLSRQDLGKIAIPCPSQSRQQQIISFVRTTQEYAEALKQKQETVRKIEKGLINQLIKEEVNDKLLTR